MNRDDTYKEKLEKRCIELEQKVEYYRKIAQQNGQKRLREVEQLNSLISESVKSEKALAESERRFRFIAQSTNDIFYEVDLGTLDVKWFGDVESALGYEPGEIKHTLEGWSNLIYHQDRPLLDDVILHLKESPIRKEVIYRVMTKDGLIRYWRDSVSPVLDNEGKCCKWAGGISDITKQKKAEENLILAQRLSAVGELASGVAHDFNNSLQGVFGYTELALQADISTEVRDYLKIIKQSAVDAAGRIKTLMRFSGKGKTQKVYESHTLSGLIDDVILQTRPLWKNEPEKAGIVIRIEKNYTEKELVIEVNASEIRTVIYNLIKNSVNAMPEGGTLSFETGKTEGSVYVSVSDTGIGMDKETRNRIFQPYFTTKPFGEGMGLGLSSAYAIVKEHDGEIYVKNSQCEKGTTIEIVLPCSENEISCGDDSLNHECSARVLWVDDEVFIRRSGILQLKKMNHIADAASGGEDALKLLKTNKYDLMITDLGMPGMNGWQLAAKTKEDYPNMKVVVLTGWGDEELKEKKEEYGVGYVVGKPLGLNNLKNLVGEVMMEKQKKDERAIL